MPTEWTQEAEQSGENRALLYDGAARYDGTYNYGDALTLWTTETETAPTVTEA